MTVFFDDNSYIQIQRQDGHHYITIRAIYTGSDIGGGVFAIKPKDTQITIITIATNPQQHEGKTNSGFFYEPELLLLVEKLLIRYEVILQILFRK